MSQRRCLFCGDPANSREHLWPKWMLDKLPSLQTIVGSVGKNKNIPVGREMKVRCVCEGCNNGWMSDLETENTLLLGPMMDGKSSYFNLQHQQSMAAWAIKTAMIMDSMTVSIERPMFFTTDERVTLRTRREIPSRTRVWLGRSHRNALVAESGGCRYSIQDSEGLHDGFIGTLFVGQLAVQVMTMRIPHEYCHNAINIQSAAGAWEELLCTIWPSNRHVDWPPILAFDNNVIPIKSLHGRWRIGTEHQVF